MLVRSFEKDQLKVKIYDTRAAMGAEAAKDAAACMRKLLETKREINMIFAAAPSQNEFLAALVKEPDIDWTRVNAFHMDEYVGLDCDTAPQNQYTASTAWTTSMTRTSTPSASATTIPTTPRR